MGDTFDDMMECAERVNKMWMRLGEQIQQTIPDILIAENDPARAIRWATCAEACFWKATGEADAHNVKDVLAAFPAERTER